jgi:hypothetical protein
MEGRSLKEMVGATLVGFSIIEMTKVYRVDDNGRESEILGFFKKPELAEAFAGAQPDANWHETIPVLILTNGTVGYVVKDQEPVKFFDDEIEAVALKKNALAKLSPAERKLLGFGE